MITFFLIIFQILFAAPTAVSAAGIFQDCGVGGSLGSSLSGAADAISFGLIGNANPTSYKCVDNLHCAEVQKFGIAIGSSPILEKACLPHTNFSPCGSAGNCAIKKGGNENCATVNSLTDSKKFGPACLNISDLPSKSGSADGCTTNADCTVGTGTRQCVRVTRYDVLKNDLANTTGEFVSAKRCIDVEKLPASVLDPNAASCGTNGNCSSDKTCVQNAYEPSGLSSYVCYNKALVSTDACPAVAGPCTINGAPGVCMNTLTSIGAIAKRCIDPIYMVGGANAPSTQICKSDSDCKAQAGAKFCLANPVTKKNQCFSQQTIFTDMSQLPKEICAGGKPCPCALPGTKACDPSGKESICVQYVDQPTKAVCINFVGNGEALSSGLTQAAEKPDYIKAEIAAQTYKQYAPKLQIDIPNLNFIQEISAQDGPGGTKFFSIPYLATYIEAVYKYAIGLGVIIAIVVLMYAGIRWMTSFGNTKAIETAKTSVYSSALGLFLLFSAYTVLYVINPDLPKLKALHILAPKQEAFWAPEDGNSDGSDGITVPGAAVNIVPGQLPKYVQCDSQWRDAPYQNKSGDMQCTSKHNVPDGSLSTDTVCKSGCGITALANVLAYNGVQVTPKEVAIASASVGAHESCAGTNAQILCNNIGKKFPGISCKSLPGDNVASLSKIIREGKPVIFSCHSCVGLKKDGSEKTYKSHFMIFTGISADGSMLDVFDVGSTNGMVKLPATEITHAKMGNVYTIEKQ